MAKTALVTEEKEKDSKSAELVANATTTVERFRTFLGDVRNEMRKVITPSVKEVQATTTVVLVTVFVFAAYFFVIDSIFSKGLALLMSKAVGPQ